MKYTYKNKKTYRMRHKLKILLTILLAVLISSTAYIMSRNAFSDPISYGTATVTFNSGNGYFEGGATSNVVTYNLVKNPVKYSHSPNILDDGTVHNTVADNIRYNDVVRIPGASSIHVEVTYDTGDYANIVCVWSGSHPDYEAYTDYSSSVSNKLNYLGTSSYDITGDTVTFGFSTNFDDLVATGYTATITADENDINPELGEIISGQYKEPISNNSTSNSFNDWSTSLENITSTCTVSASYATYLATGTYEGVDWKITNRGELIIGKKGNTQSFSNNTNRVYNSWPWYTYRSNIKSVRFEGNVIGYGSFKEMFSSDNTAYDDGYNKIAAIDLTGLNTTHVVNMNGMFRELISLTSLDVGSLVTTNVTDMQRMFYKNVILLELDVSNFNTSNVLDMSGMFMSCGSLTSLDLSNFNTSNVTYMNSLVCSCTSLINLDMSSFNTSNVTDMRYMFRECKKMPAINVSSFNTSNVTDMGCMFEAMKCLTSINLSNFNTSKVTRMDFMFSTSDALESINLSNFDTKLVVDFGSMFQRCSMLTSANLSNFDFRSAEDTGGMFNSCEKLESISFSNIVNNTHTLLDTNHMFGGCYKLKSLDITSLDMTNVTNMDYMFNGCYRLFTLKLGTNWKFLNGAGLTDNWKRQSTGVVYTVDQLVSAYNSSMADTYIRLAPLAIIYSNNEMVFQIGDDYDPTKGEVVADFAGFDKTTWTSSSSRSWVNKVSSITKVIFKDNITTVSTAYWFYNMTSLSEVVDINKLNCNNVTNMKYMFYNCSSLTELDLSGLNTSNVTDMSYMFRSCSNLETLNLGSIDATNVTTMNYLFYGDSKLKMLVLGENWKFLSSTYLSNSWQRVGDTTIYTAAELINSYNGSTMAGTYKWPNEKYAELDSSTGVLRIFEDEGNLYTNGQVIGTKTYYTGLEAVTGSTKPKWYSKRSIITSVVIEDEFKPKTAYYLFGDSSNLSTITGILNLNTSQITNMEYMFDDCSSLINLDVTGLDTSNVTTMFNMFSGCSSLTSLDLSNFDTDNLMYINNMFKNCSNLITLDISNFNTSNITDMSCIFYGCSSLTSLDLSSFDTSNVTDMFQMFYNCSSLTELDVSNFNTSSATNLPNMFQKCSGLTSLNLSNFNTSGVEDFHSMFLDCSNLTSVNLSSFNTSNVTDMGYMFSGCSNLTTLDLTNFDTSNVTTMQSMFSNTTKLRILKLGTNWKFNSSLSTGLSKSWIRDGDTTLYTASQLVNSYNGSTMAGTYRAMQQLTISEKVKGALANINKNFDFTINVQEDGVGINSTYGYTGTKTGNMVFTNGNATFVLKHGDNISTYFPYGVNYTITQDSDGYTLSSSYASGTLNSNKTATFTDTLNGTTPTGIFFDLVPFIILLTFGIFSIILIKKYKYI